jgi:hypothetical protein
MISFMTQLFKILFSTFVLLFGTSTWGATPSTGTSLPEKSSRPPSEELNLTSPKATSSEVPTENSSENFEGLQITQPLHSEKEIHLRIRNANMERAVYLGLGYFSGYGTTSDQTLSTFLFTMGHLRIVNNSFYAFDVELPEPGLLGASARKGWFFSSSSTRPFYALGVRAWLQGSDQLASILKYERYAPFAEIGLGDLWTQKQMISGAIRAGSAMNGFFISTSIQWQFPY